MTDKPNPFLLFLKALWRGFKRLPFISDFLGDYPRLTMVRLSGIIADSNVRKQGLSHCRLAKIIDKAFARPGIKGVVLVINSPGGSPAQSQLIGNHIRALAEEKDLPVYAFIEDVAASGGYWLACAADEIYAQESSVIGSIGVISSGFGMEGLIDRYDIKRRLYTAGKDKSFMDPFSPERKDDVARLKTLLGDMHDIFKDWVRDRRAGLLKEEEKSLFEGGFWLGAKAVDLGLIDGIGDAREMIREKFGKDARLIDLTPERKFPFSPFGARLPGAMGVPEEYSLADDIIATLETRAEWNRYGL